MPYKYIGKTTSFKGKTLWEIVGNLKNFGIGRIVTRSRFERYPEPSYFKILKVETLANPKESSVDFVRNVKVLVERTFRGQTKEKPVLIESASYKADYRLIPKDEEAEYCKCKVPIQTAERILPRTIEFPPVLKQLLMTEMEKKGETEELVLDVICQQGRESKYRIANEGEKPNVEIPLGLGTPASPDLYKGINLS